jgi:hypothetical protein
MPRRPKIIKAKYKTKCPNCAFSVVPGTLCKVYADEWYHMDCWNSKWEKVLDKKIEEESKQVEQDSLGFFVGLANSIEDSSSEIKGEHKVGAKKKFENQTKIQVFLEQSDRDFVDEFAKNTYRSVSEVIRFSLNKLKKDYNENGAKYGI